MADDVTRSWSSSMRHLRTVDDARAWLKGRVERPGPHRLGGPGPGHPRPDRAGSACSASATTPAAPRSRTPCTRASGVAGSLARRWPMSVRYGVEQLGLHRVALHPRRRQPGVLRGRSQQRVRLRGGRAGGDRTTATASCTTRTGTRGWRPTRRVRPLAAPQPLDPVTLTGDGCGCGRGRDDDAGVVLAGLSDPAGGAVEPAPAAARPGGGASVGSPGGPSAGPTGARPPGPSRRTERWWGRWRCARSTGSTGGPRRRTGRCRRPAGAGWRRARWRLAATYAVDGLGLHRVQLQHALANTASCRVATKAGFALEGTQLGSCLLADGFADEHLHARVVGR